jgi:hypothetical protein
MNSEKIEEIDLHNRDYKVMTKKLNSNRFIYFGLDNQKQNKLIYLVILYIYWEGGVLIGDIMISSL